MEDKRVIIIGAGISGLAAGVYLQRSGFDVTILEKHVLPGGLSTAWSRRGYYFEGGMHWLTGSSPALALNRVWHEEGALMENNPVTVRPVLYTVVHGAKDGGDLHLFRDVDRLREHLIQNAPEDKKAIEALCRDIRKFSRVHLPVMDVPGTRTTRRYAPSLRELLMMIPAGLRYPALRRQSFGDYTARFKNGNVRALLSCVINTTYNALSLVYTLGSFASGDCGFPEGGSIRMARNMADTFTALGGTIRYRTEAQGILVQDGKVRGVTCGAETLESPRVIAAFDSLSAVDALFDPPLADRWIQRMKRTVVDEQNVFVGLGIRADLSRYPFAMTVPLAEDFMAGGIAYRTLRLYNYASRPGYAPEGCTTMTCLLLGRSYGWWSARKADGTYAQEKRRLAEALSAVIARVIPESAGKVEVTDVATPCTYERYTASHHGSWMSVWEPGGKTFSFPARSTTVRGLYFASQRNQMPGGLPICAVAGRRAAQQICKGDGVLFRTDGPRAE